MTLFILINNILFMGLLCDRDGKFFRRLLKRPPLSTGHTIATTEAPCARNKYRKKYCWIGLESAVIFFAHYKYPRDLVAAFGLSIERCFCFCRSRVRAEFSFRDGAVFFSFMKRWDLSGWKNFPWNNIAANFSCPTKGTATTTREPR